MRKGPIPTCLLSVVTTILLIGTSLSASAQVRAITEDIDVVVRKGDNLTSIVQKVMGSAEFWPEVADINKIERPDALTPEQVIRFPSNLVQKRNFAKVAFSKGVARLTRFGADSEIAVEKGNRIFLGDVITTGEDGFVSLSFAGESFVNVQPDSQIQIVQFDCFDTEKPCVVNLFSDEGQMSFDVRNIGFTKPPRYSIETPYASAAVRGTRFDVEVQQESVLGVTEGLVQVTSGVTTASLPLGKGTVAGEGRSISTTYDLLDQPEYQQFMRVSAEDYVSWDPIDEARIYRYVLAENESLSDVIVSGSTSDTFVQVLPGPRQFYLSTRALDENGIKGFRAVRRIDQVSIDESVAAPLLEIELSENQLRIRNTGELASEIHIGEQLEPTGELEELLTYRAFDIAGGETLELSVEADQDVYIASRAVISSSAVSPYGNIYEFKRNAR